MIKASFSIFLEAGAEPRHPALATALENIRAYRGNETTADKEIAILRIGEIADPALLRAYLDWMGENLGIVNPPADLRDRHHHTLRVLLGSDHGVTEQAKTRIHRALLNPSAVGAPRESNKDRAEGQ